MAWTEDRVKILATMWLDGKSASEIARHLGGVTRNAVIGKVHRMGLSNRTEARKKFPTGTPPTPPTPAKKKAETRTPPAKTEEASSPANNSPAPPKAESAPVAEPPVQATPVPPKKIIIPAGQPLPPQPSQNEASEEALARVALAEKSALKLKLMQLTKTTCKWPIGDPATDEFWFCGLQVQEGKPYCEAHGGLAYQPMSARRDRRSR